MYFTTSLFHGPYFSSVRKMFIYEVPKQTPGLRKWGVYY